MAGDDLVQVAERLATILGDSCLLVGGLAVSAWGHIRATEDVDFICSLRPEDIQRMLSAEGISSEHRRGDILEGDIPWVVEGELSGVSFQILPPLVPVNWERATTIPMPNGTELRVVDIDDLVHLKLVAGGVLDGLDRWLTDPRLKEPRV